MISRASLLVVLANVIALASLASCVLPPVDASGRACDVDGACAAGFTCVEGACEKVCAADTDCPGERVCVEGACLVRAEGEGEGEGEGEEGEGEGEGEGAGEGEGEGEGENAAPIAVDDVVIASTPADEAIVIEIPATDADGDALSVLVDVGPAHGTATPGAPSAPGGVATLTYTPDDGFAGRDTIAVRVSDGALATAEVIEVIVDVIGRSCVHVLNTGGSRGSGVYVVDLTPDDAVDDEDEVFCDMSTAAGGFMLALKVDGDAQTFCYDAPIWTDDVLLNETSVDETPTEAKLAPYVLSPASELLVVVDEIDDAAEPAHSLVVPLSAGTAQLALPLREIMEIGTQQDTVLDDDDWQNALFPSDGDGIHTRTEGINVVRSPLSAVRIGQLGDTCCTLLSSVGIGMRSNQCVPGGIDLVTAGARVEECCSGPRALAVDARVSVRSRDFTFLPARASCAAHEEAGSFLTGTYLVDSDGVGGAAAAPTTCPLGDFRRIARFERNGVAPDDACPAPLVDAPGGIGCVRDDGDDVASLVFESPIPIRRIKGRFEGVAQGTLEAFNSDVAVSLDNVYVDGISVTVEEPRRHAFTFAVGTETSDKECPCGGGSSAPGFVGNNNICEERDSAAGTTFDDDTLWGAGALNGACTQNFSANEFTLTFGVPSTGPVEVRIMLDGDDGADPTEDIALQRLELFVQ